MKRMMMKDEKNILNKVLVVNRVSKTVTGGRVMSFSALVACGDNEGGVGIGLGKAMNVADAVRKGTATAKRNMKKYSLSGATIPHEAMGKFGASNVFVKSAPQGRGMVAGSVVKDILELAGISDVLTKIIGSKNKVNVAKATIDALSQLRTYEEVLTVRGKSPRR